MKHLRYFIVPLASAVLYNGVDFFSEEVAELNRSNFWKLTPAMFLFFVLCVLYMLGFHRLFQERWMRRYAYDWSEVSLKSNRSKLPFGEKMLFHLSSVLLAVILFAYVIYILLLDREDSHSLMKEHLLYRVPFLSFILLGYSHAVYRGSDWPRGIYLSFLEIKRDELLSADMRLSLDLLAADKARDACLQVLLNALVNSFGDSPKTILVSDIVLIESYSKKHYLILTDGSRHACSNILRLLIQLEVMGWFVKLSDRYKVNMMFVEYPVLRANELVQLNAVVRDNMCHNMQQGAIAKMLIHGPAINGKYVQEFLDNRQHLRLEGMSVTVRL